MFHHKLQFELSDQTRTVAIRQDTEDKPINEHRQLVIPNNIHGCDQMAGLVERYVAATSACKEALLPQHVHQSKLSSCTASGSMSQSDLYKYLQTATK